ncbi:MAG: hypothetical protein WCJ02_17025 [bacterium]
MAGGFDLLTEDKNMPRDMFFTALCLALTLVAHAQEKKVTSLPGKRVDLLRDTRFQNGFEINAPKPGKHVAMGVFQPPSATNKPSWRLCQWNSKYDLSEAKPEILSNQTIRMANAEKSVTISSQNTSNDLILALDSRPEYKGNVRTKGQPWPHLLVEQTVQPIVLFKDISRISFTIQARLLTNECFKLEGYTRNLHTAQFPMTFIVQNRNKQSKGFGDFIWFCVTLYDERKPFTDLYAAKDTADPSAKMIYTPPSKTFSQQTLHDGTWATFSHTNLCTLFSEAISLARARGYLKESPDVGDFAISSVNIGWEVTGINNVAIQIRNLDIKVDTKQQAPPGPAAAGRNKPIGNFLASE